MWSLQTTEVSTQALYRRRSHWSMLLSRQGLTTPLWFYRRTLLVHQRWLLIAWWINLIQIILWVIGSTLFYIFQCIPPGHYWQRMYVSFQIPPPSPVSGQCNSATPVLVALPLISSLISDFGILVLPVTIVSRLHMRTCREIGLIAVFSLGLL